MVDYAENLSIKGERSLSRGFIAQYAAEAALRVPGVAFLDTGLVVSLKEAFGAEHYGKGIRVRFDHNDSAIVNIDAYPVMYYGCVLPDVAWEVQEKIKADVEKYTGLIVHEVNVQVMSVIERER
ncbi:MAG: Asp23/Gls24 family envelope stress response protein [Eubacteriales bacterium]|nr:Asp23/Gls24 family envelope stress response protein [Eubacteriales bacterium]